MAVSSSILKYRKRPPIGHSRRATHLNFVDGKHTRVIDTKIMYFDPAGFPRGSVGVAGGVHSDQPLNGTW